MSGGAKEYALADCSYPFQRADYGVVQHIILYVRKQRVVHERFRRPLCTSMVIPMLLFMMIRPLTEAVT